MEKIIHELSANYLLLNKSWLLFILRYYSIYSKYINTLEMLDGRVVGAANSGS